MNAKTAERSFQNAIKAVGGLYTASDMARSADCTEQAIYDRLRRGTIPQPAFQVGRLRVWLGAQLPSELKRKK